MGAPVHALVPLKRLDGAKSRLRGRLEKDERAQLMQAMLADVVDAVAAAKCVSVATLVSSEPSAPRLAHDHGIQFWDDRDLPWNVALSAAMSEVVEEPLVAVISADIPLVQADEIDELVRATPEVGIAIARASDGGTNAVALRPPGIIETCFGAKYSASLHATTAHDAGVQAQIVDTPGLAHDLDTPEDVRRFLSVPRETRTRALVSPLFSMEVTT